jgi:hypothetical protein
MGLNIIKNARQISKKWKILVDTHLLLLVYQLNLHDVNAASETYIIEKDVDLQLLTYDIWAKSMVALTVVANQQKGKKPLHALSMQQLRKVCNDFDNFVHGYFGG